MQAHFVSADGPGFRIEGHRNSTPRNIRLVGLGLRGGKIARSVAMRDLPNVGVITSCDPVDWDDVTEAEGGLAVVNMIVIVCAEGDQALFKPVQGKPDALVTFVVFQSGDHGAAAVDSASLNARAFSDLFVTTSDAGYVMDLVENLGS